MSRVDCPQHRASLAAVTRLLLRSSARAALRVALPFYFALLIAAVVLFAGNGLDARTVTAAGERSWVARLGLLAGWLVATVPATRALLHDRHVQFLKSLPVRERDILIVLASLLLIAELPWVILWARGAGIVAAGGATFLALALRTLWLSRPLSTRQSALAVVLLISWSATSTQSPVVLLIGHVVFVAALRWAWRRSPEEAPRARWWRVGGPAVVALASAHMATLLRTSSAVLIRSLSLSFVAGTFSFFLLIHDERHDWMLDLQRVEAIYVLAAWVPVASLGGPMLRTERAAAWVLDSHAVALPQRRRALALALAFANGVLAIGHAVVLGSALGLAAPRIARVCIELAAMAIGLAVVGEGALRRAIKDDGRDGARLTLLTVAVVMAAESAIMAFPRTVAAGWLGAAGLSLITSERSRPDRAATSGGARPWH